MEENNFTLVSQLRKVAGSPRVSALRRLRAVDELAAMSCLYFVEPTDRPFVESSKRGRALIKKYLTDLLKGKAQAHRAVTLDRLRMVNGENIPGLFRCIDDPQTPAPAPVEPEPDLSTIEGIRVEIARLKAAQEAKKIGGLHVV